MIQQHFAKYLGKQIWNLQTEQKVTLTAVRTDCLMFLNGKPFEQEGIFEEFRILCNSDEEVIKNDIPIDWALIELETTVVRKPMKFTPPVFLEKLKTIVYPVRNLTHEIMWENRHNRKRIYCVPRQVIMAAYFCAFEHKGVTLDVTAAIYSLDHATALNAIKAVNNLLDTDRYFRDEYKNIWELVLLVNPKSRLNIN